MEPNNKKYAFIYRLLKSLYLRAIVGTSFGIILTIQFQLSDLKNYKVKGSTFLNEIKGVIIIFVLTIIYNWIIIAIDKREKKQQELQDNKIIGLESELKLKQDILDNYNESARHLQAIHQYVNSELYQMKGTLDIMLTKPEYKLFDFQHVATVVCASVYDLIKNATDNKDHQVSIMLKCIDDVSTKECITMIAYGNENSIYPSDFKKPYFLDDKEYRYSYPVKIFNEQINKIYIINNESGIKRYLRPYYNREGSNIKQYIGMPVFCEVIGTVALLQIDTCNEFLFGITEEEIRDFFKRFYSFIHILLVYYNVEELLKLLPEKINQLKEQG